MARRSNRLAVALIWLPAWVVLLPVLVVGWRAWGDPGPIWQQIVEDRLSGYVWQSALLVGLVTLLAVVFGVPAAWHVSVHEFPGRKFLEWALLLPLAMPGFVAAAAYIDSLQSLVPFYVWIRRVFGIEAFLVSQQIAPWVFSIIVLAATLFPYVFISCRAIFVREAAGSLEAARMLGAGHRRVFLTVALPMARPAIVAGASLVGMEAMNDYGVVTAFGLGTLTPGIFRAWTEGFPGAAMRLAMILMGMTLLFISLERWQRGKRRFAGDPSEAPLARHRLGPLGIAFAWLVCGGPLLLGFVVPVVRMMRWAVQSHDRMDWAGHLAAVGNSIFLACGAAVLVTLGAIVLVAGGRAFPGKSLRSAQRVGILGYAFPSALVAVGVGAMVSGLSGFPGFGILALSASTFGLMLAYFVRFLAVGIQPVAAGFEAVSGSLHEAARTLGVKPVRALLRIDLPLVWPVLVAGATLAFIDVFKELTLTLVLRPFDFETLATRTYRLAGESRIPEASVPALSLVRVSLVGLIPLTYLLRQRPR
ncbi:MAG: ABC transporter permease [Luteolibacter sp.]